jgi:hypothetical protein
MACGFEMTVWIPPLPDRPRRGGAGTAPEPPDPFDDLHPDAFVAWLNSPAEGGPPRVSR